MTATASASSHHVRIDDGRGFTLTDADFWEHGPDPESRVTCALHNENGGHYGRPERRAFIALRCKLADQRRADPYAGHNIRSV